MTASDSAKSAGLKSLAEASKRTGVSTQTLNNWFNHKPDLFKVVIAGCLHLREYEKERTNA
jgi:lambda repressor-like predicted transcriptional regulator